MKPQNDPKKSRFNFGRVMYITVIVASICLVGANVFMGSQKEKIRVMCDSGSFFDRIKDDHPELDVIVVNSDVTRGELGDPSVSSSASSSPSNPEAINMINLNTATAEELQTLNGIGETKAAAIIQYRTENGGFRSIEEICRVKGIGDATFKKIRDKITV